MAKQAEKPKGEGRWFELAERYRDERDEALAELEKARGTDSAEKIALEADLTKYKTEHASLVAVMREIANNPLLGRDQVQSRLLLALERYG